MKHCLICLSILLLIASAPGLFSQTEPAVPSISDPQVARTVSGKIPAEDLEIFVDGIMRVHMVSRHIAGAVFAAVQDGEILFSKGYGYADVEAGKPAAADTTLFRPGSVSKLFVWTAVMQLVEQGKLDLEEDINAYLKAFQIPDTFAQPITLAHLMTHTPGFEETVVGMAARKSEDLISLEDYLAANIPHRVFPPGELTAYSNYGSALAAYIVQVVSGIPFEEYVERSIFSPLGMGSSTFRQPLPERLSEQMSGGYTYGRGVFKQDTFELINGMAPAGSMSTTAEDLARFMIAHLQDGGTPGGARILDQGTAQLMHTRLFAHDARINGNSHGFWEWEYNGLRTIQHGGDTLLFHSFLVLIPELNTGFFVSYNSVGGGGAPSKQLMEAIIDRYFPAEIPTTVESPPDSGGHAGRFTGLYMLSRVNYSSFLKIMQLFMTVKVTALPEGALLIGGGSDPKRYMEVEPLVFREHDGQNLVVFKEDAEGRITHMFLSQSPYVAGIKLAWHQRPLLHLLILVITVLVFCSTLIWPLGALRRSVCRYSAVPADAPRAARWLAGGMSGLCVLFLLGMVLVFSRPESVMFGIPLMFKLLLLLPFAASALAVGVLFHALVSWIKGYWYPCSRIHYLLVLLAFLGFLWLLNAWNLLGFKF